MENNMLEKQFTILGQALAIAEENCTKDTHVGDARLGRCIYGRHGTCGTSGLGNGYGQTENCPIVHLIAQGIAAGLVRGREV